MPFGALSLQDGTDDGIATEVYIVCIVGRATRCDGHGLSEKMLVLKRDMVGKYSYIVCICLPLMNINPGIVR